MSEPLTQQDFAAAGLEEWRVDGGSAVAELTCRTFTEAGELAATVAAICDAQDHHADLEIHYPGVLTVTTTSHDVGGLTDRDLRLATFVSRAHRAGR